MNAAQIILSQINGIDPRALWAWGAKNMVNTGDGLKFQTSGMTRWKGHVYIKYNTRTDLYDIKFYRIRKAEIKTDNNAEGVYADELVNFIDEFVG